jgi:hypothetical protein
MHDRVMLPGSITMTLKACPCLTHSLPTDKCPWHELCYLIGFYNASLAQSSPRLGHSGQWYGYCVVQQRAALSDQVPWFGFLPLSITVPFSDWSLAPYLPSARSPISRPQWLIELKAEASRLHQSVHPEKSPAGYGAGHYCFLGVTTLQLPGMLLITERRQSGYLVGSQ